MFTSQEEFEKHIKELEEKHPGLRVARPLPQYNRLNSFWFGSNDTICNYNYYGAYSAGEMEVTMDDEKGNIIALTPSIAIEKNLTDEDLGVDSTKEIYFDLQNWIGFEKEEKDSEEVDYLENTASDFMEAIDIIIRLEES
jgi:hypothetical protein